MPEISITSPLWIGALKPGSVTSARKSSVYGVKRNRDRLVNRCSPPYGVVPSSAHGGCFDPRLLTTTLRPPGGGGPPIPTIVPSSVEVQRIGPLLRRLSAAVFQSAVVSYMPSPSAWRGTLNVRPNRIPETSWNGRW